MVQYTGGIMMAEGLDTSKPAEYITKSSTPDCQNITVEQSVLRKRVGTTQLGQMMSGFWDVNYDARLYLADNVALTHPWVAVTSGIGTLTREADTDALNGYRLTQNSSTTAATDTAYYTQAGSSFWQDNVDNAVGYNIEVRAKVVTSGSARATTIQVFDGSYVFGLFFKDTSITVDGSYISEATQTYTMDTTDAYHVYEITVKGTELKVYVDRTLRISGTLDSVNANKYINIGDSVASANLGGITYWDYMRFSVKDDTRWTTDEDSEIMGGREFTRSGVKYVVRVGLKKIEEWNAGTSIWDDITGTQLTGTTSDAVHTATPLLTGSRILVLTNGIDNIRKYTGTGNTADLGGSPPKAKYILEYGAYLVLANITSGGTDYTMRVQWCDTGDPETWSGGNSGAKDLIEDGKDITGLAGYGAFVSVHKESSIYLGYLVSTSSIMSFDRKATGAGTVCNATIQSLPTGEQAFLSTDGIRLFNGLSAPIIENKILEEIRYGLNPAYVHKSWSIVAPELDEYWVGVPIGSQTTGDTVYKYNYRTKVVHKDTRSNIISAFKYSKTSDLTWDDMTLTWDQSTTRWNDRSAVPLFPIILLNDNEGYTTERDTTVNDDNGVAIDSFWESKDYTAQDLSENSAVGQLVNWLNIDVYAKGNSVEVDYSTDSGQTWKNIADFVLSDDYPGDTDPDIGYYDVLSSKIRFRFRNRESDESFYLKQFVVSGILREMRMD